MRGSRPLKLVYVVVDDRSVRVSLEDGRALSVPLDWYPRLVHASPAERNNWRLIMGGRAVSWQPLGLAVSAKALIEGDKATEPPVALRKWLAARRSPTSNKRKAG